MVKREINRTVTQKRIYLWNAAGSLCNAGASVILLWAVTRLAGPIAGGIFSIAFAVAQQMLTVASFESATYQVTDGRNVYRFGTYCALRLILYLLSVLIGFVVAVFSGYSIYKCLVVLFLCLYKGLDSFNATFSASLQRHGRLDIGGKSFALRICFSTAIFIVVMAVTKELLTGAISMLAFSVLWEFFYEMPYTDHYEKIKLDFSVKPMISLTMECLPLFLGSFLMMYICNAPKYAVDRILVDEALNTDFGILMMPSAVISLLSIFIYRPVLTKLTDWWLNGEVGCFVQSIAKMGLLVLLLTGICVLGAFWLGIPVLSLLFGLDLSPYRSALCLIVAGGGMYALANLLYNAIVIFRKQRLMIVMYAVSAAFAFVMAPIMVKHNGLEGGSVTYLLSTMVLASSMTALFAFLVRKNTKKS